MSCLDGSCAEPGKRLRALIMLGLMMLIFIMLSAFSFMRSRGQVTPDQIRYAGESAIAGKRVFQAYNCMDCHTIVGNGAYLAPDLTKVFQNAGPAWLAAFLPSAGQWPTEGAVQAQLMNGVVAGEAGVSTIEAYYEKFPGAKERVQRRGGGATFMPNLRFRTGEVEQLIAFLKYTSAMNNEGWPPEVQTGSLQRRLELFHGKSAAVVPASAPAAPAVPQEPATPEARGAELAKSLGCLACHDTGNKKLIGPAWGGLYGSQVKLTDGTTVTADEMFVRNSILEPNAQVAEGYMAGTMPPFGALLKEEQIEEIVAYIKSLGAN